MGRPYQLVTMSKFLALGMEIGAVVRADLGCLSVGAVGDASVIELVEGEFEYRDVLGEVRPSRQQLAARGLVVGGRRWHPPR